MGARVGEPEAWQACWMGRWALQVLGSEHTHRQGGQREWLPDPLWEGRLLGHPATSSLGPKLCSCVSPGPHRVPGPQMARDQLRSRHGARVALRGTLSYGKPKTESPWSLAPRGMTLSPRTLPLLAEGGVDQP